MPRYLCTTCTLDFFGPHKGPGICPACGRPSEIRRKPGRAAPPATRTGTRRTRRGRPREWDPRTREAPQDCFGLSFCPFEHGRFSGLCGLDARITPLG